MFISYRNLKIYMRCLFIMCRLFRNNLLSCLILKNNFRTCFYFKYIVLLLTLECSRALSLLYKSWGKDSWQTMLHTISSRLRNNSPSPSTPPLESTLFSCEVHAVFGFLPEKKMKIQFF